MAPELLIEGRASRASDVYAYGILLWEMLTGQRAFNGTPIALLAHNVARKGARPSWPKDERLCPPLQALAELCWATDASSRWVQGTYVLQTWLVILLSAPCSGRQLTSDHTLTDLLEKVKAFCRLKQACSHLLILHSCGKCPRNRECAHTHGGVGLHNQPHKILVPGGKLNQVMEVHNSSLAR